MDLGQKFINTIYSGTSEEKFQNYLGPGITAIIILSFWSSIPNMYYTMHAQVLCK